MRKAPLIILILFLAAQVLPSSDKRRAYQRMLWTARQDPWATGGWQRDNGVEVAGVTEWDRIRFGFPFQATTLDRQREAGAWQMRIERQFLYFNLICWLLCSGAIPAAPLAARFARRFAGSHPEPDK